MSKSRISKFIFADSGFFLRMKTEAKNLKVRKDGDDYIMEIPTHSEKGDYTEIPLIFTHKVTNLSEAQADSVKLGCDKDLIDKATHEKDFEWGRVVKIKNFSNDMHCYYLLAEGLDGVVRIGPLHKGVDGSKIEMDFTNLQWEEL